VSSWVGPPLIALGLAVRVSIFLSVVRDRGGKVFEDLGQIEQVENALWGIRGAV